MNKSRKDKNSSSKKLTDAMKNNPKNDYWIQLMTVLVAITTDFSAKVTKRETLKLERMKSSEVLKETENTLIELLLKANNFILAFVSVTDLKYKEFTNGLSISEVIYTSMRNLISNAEYFLKGMKNNTNIAGIQTFIDLMEPAIINFDEALKQSQLKKQEEVDAINALKLIEDEFDSTYEKTARFVKNEIEPNDYPNYF